MRRPRLPARVLPLVRLVGPWGWIAAGVLAGALAAGVYLRRTRAHGQRSGDDVALSQWDTDGGGWRGA